MENLSERMTEKQSHWLNCLCFHVTLSVNSNFRSFLFEYFMASVAQSRVIFLELTLRFALCKTSIPAVVIRGTKKSLLKQGLRPYEIFKNTAVFRQEHRVYEIFKALILCISIAFPEGVNAV